MEYSVPHGLDDKATITIEGKEMQVDAAQLVKQKVLGRGAYGVVERMLHVPTGTLMAVKVSSSFSESPDDPVYYLHGVSENECWVQFRLRLK